MRLITRAGIAGVPVGDVLSEEENENIILVLRNPRNSSQLFQSEP